MDSVFFTNFLMISDTKTIIFLIILLSSFYIMNKLSKNKVNFSKRMLLATIMGLILGFVIQLVSGFSEDPTEVVFVNEVIKWYSLFGTGFLNLIRMLVIPIIIVSIIHLIVNMKENTNISKLTRNTLIITTSMVLISVIVSIAVGFIFNLGKGISYSGGTAEIQDVTNVVDTLIALIPQNPIQAMVDTNIIALVIMAAFFGMGARRMSKKYIDVVKPFIDLINALHKIIMSVAMTIIKGMPYAVIALFANTIAQRGIYSIIEVGIFIIALYVAIIIMFIIQLLVLVLFGVNPIIYFKKAISVMVLAFTSRSSVGTLPLTIETLVNRMGVSDGTASFVAGFGTTAGMQGCAGIFPTLILIYVYNLNNLSIDFAFISIAIVVIVISSFGIAGIPSAATMSVSITLAGVGQASLFPSISPILAIDPILDMGRTCLNVTGAMSNAIIIDKTLGQFNSEVFTDMTK